MAYVPKITRARFVLGPFSAEDMTIIGKFMCDRIRRRIESWRERGRQPLEGVEAGVREAEDPARAEPDPRLDLARPDAAFLVGEERQ